jgi:hypothetical protein
MKKTEIIILLFLLKSFALVDIWAQGTNGQNNNSPILTFDLAVQKKIVKNIFSDVNVWDFRRNWGTKANMQQANYFSTHYPFVKTVQFMTATGGNVSRDLFTDPLNNDILNDYRFDDLISALGHVVKQGLKPMIKTGAVPLKYSVHPSIGGFGVNVEPKTSQLTITGNVLTLTPELTHHGLVFYEITNVRPVQ